jgi:hypothetical protein
MLEINGIYIIVVAILWALSLIGAFVLGFRIGLWGKVRQKSDDIIEQASNGNGKKSRRVKLKTA